MDGKLMVIKLFATNYARDLIYDHTAEDNCTNPR
jgi:hypothetical protein